MKPKRTKKTPEAEPKAEWHRPENLTPAQAFDLGAGLFSKGVATDGPPPDADGVTFGGLLSMAERELGAILDAAPDFLAVLKNEGTPRENLAREGLMVAWLCRAAVTAGDIGQVGLNAFRLGRYAAALDFDRFNQYTRAGVKCKFYSPRGGEATREDYSAYPRERYESELRKYHKKYPSHSFNYARQRLSHDKPHGLKTLNVSEGCVRKHLPRKPAWW